MGMDIARSEFAVNGYINGFRKSGENWFVQASLIVDKNRSDAEKPFVFQRVSLLVIGSAKKLLEVYEDESGAIRGYGVDDANGKKKIFRFLILGYRVEASDNPDFPFDVKGRVVAMDDLAEYMDY
jgi:hypothetical protein